MKPAILFIALFVALFTIQAAHYLPLPGGSDNHNTLKGDWQVDTGSFLPLSIAPRCQPVVGGTLFRFTDTELLVLTDTLGPPCGSYRYAIAGQTISFIRQDMVWLCTYRVANDSLTLRSTHFFTPYYANPQAENNKPAASREEITVLLIKQNQ